MIEVVALERPLESARLQWIADLYGSADPKYRSLAQLEHLFVNSPGGPGLHAFALDEARPVGHCAVVPMPARAGERRFTAGKVEALVVEPQYRGRRGSDPPVAVELRQALYALADARGIELLHAYVRPEVGRVLDLAPYRVAPPSLVAVIRPRPLARSPARAAEAGAAVVQQAAATAARLAVRGVAAETRAPTADDEDLVATPPPPPGRWTVVAEDAWPWLCNAPSLRVLELESPVRARVLLQLPGGPGGALRIVSWRAERPTTALAVRVLAAAARLARESGAGTLRYQPWSAASPSRPLVRACRLLGFIAREDFSTLFVRTQNAALATPAAVVSTPLLGLGF
jgi:GNAT superfamily N-acetyltransferase